MFTVPGAHRCSPKLKVQKYLHNNATHEICQVISTHSDHTHKEGETKFQHNFTERERERESFYSIIKTPSTSDIMTEISATVKEMSLQRSFERFNRIDFHNASRQGIPEGESNTALAVPLCPGISRPEYIKERSKC